MIQGQAATPNGYNKQLRHNCRIFLCAAGVSLVLGYSFVASICSVAGVLVLHGGTLFSTKNLKWGLTAYITVFVSFFAYFMHWAASIIDQEKAYILKMVLFLCGRGSELMWGAILLIFLLMANSAPGDDNEAAAPINKKKML